MAKADDPDEVATVGGFLSMTSNLMIAFLM